MRTEVELIADWQLEAAQCVADVQLHYARAGVSLASAAMAGAPVLETLRHYPAADVVDAKAGTRFYYHAHASSRRPADEHGHFHLFAYPDGTSSGPDFIHLAGLSLDPMGLPLRWFTTNGWVTGERWRPAVEVVSALQNFQSHTRGRLAPVARWLTAMVRLFEPQLTALVHRRDAVLARRFEQQGREPALHDRSLDVVTQCAVSLPRRLQQLAR